MGIKVEDLFLRLVAWELGEKGYLGYYTDMALLVIKSLLPEDGTSRVYVNYERYIREMNLWYQYREDWNKSLANARNCQGDLYWDLRDDSIIARLIPLVIVNGDFNPDEISKNILFTSGNLEDLFENLALGHLIYSLLRNKGDFLARLKDFIIGFSQEDFMEKNKKFFRQDLSLYRGNYKVDFERKKIQLISKLNGQGSGFKILEDFLLALDGERPEAGFSKILLGDPSRCQGLPDNILSFNDYLLSLARGRIYSSDLELREYIMPDIFSFSEGDSFYHSLLNKSYVLKNYREGDLDIVLVRSKSGLYKFKK